MANYYTKFSECYRLNSRAEADWIKAQLDRNILQRLRDYNTDGHTGDDRLVPKWAKSKVLAVRIMESGDGVFEWEIDQDASKSWRLSCWSEENGDTTAVGILLSSYLRKFAPDSFCTLRWVGDCDKPRLDAYGGGAMFITAFGVACFSTQEWLEQQSRQLLQHMISQNMEA